MSEGSSSEAVDSDSKPGMSIGCHWAWEATDRAEGDSLKGVGCWERWHWLLCWWEHAGNTQRGHRLLIFWIPLQNRLGQLLVFRLHCLGNENSTLPLFVGAESDPRGYGLSCLKPGVDIGELVRVSGGSYYDLINGPDSGG
jgi:hypothetical protein